MIKISLEHINRMDGDYPGIKDDILRFEIEKMPACPVCESADTASVQIGIIQRTMNIAVATTKFKLIPNRPKPGEYYCNACEQFFDV